MIYFHADDYGITPNQDKKILDCNLHGKLNSISILPNTEYQKEALEILNDIDKEKNIRRVLHLNFVEGKLKANPDLVSMLVDSKGNFNKSFIDIWKWNFFLYGKKRQVLKKQLKEEIKAQFYAVTKENNYEITAVDSHQHYHMIPIVFDAMMEVIMEDYREIIKEVRVPVDPLSLLITTPCLWKEFRFINLIKWLILKPFGDRNRRILNKCGIGVPLFFGIFFTCEMKGKIVQTMLPKYEKKANIRKKDLELMFHPGSLDSKIDLLDPKSKELEEFYFSKNREAEADCLKRI